MNKILNYKYLPYLILGLGGLGMVLQSLLLLLYTDSKGLLPSGHFLHILAWLIGIAAIVLTVVTVIGLNGPNRYNANFPASVTGAVGSFLAAAGIAVSILFYGDSIGDFLSIAWRILGFLSILALVFTGICRLQGLRPAFFFHAAVCLFFALHLVCRCRSWSSEPQLERYSFALFACIGLMLTAYYRAAFDSGIGRRRMQLAAGLLTCFFCLASIPCADDPLLYLTGAVWAITNLCVLTPPRRRPRPRPAPPTEGQ